MCEFQSPKPLKQTNKKPKAKLEGPIIPETPWLCNSHITLTMIKSFQNTTTKENFW